MKKYFFSIFFLIILFGLSFSPIVYAQNQPGRRETIGETIGNAIGTTIIPTQDEFKELVGKPTHRITIPGITYTDVQPVKDGNDIYLYIPYLGEYLSVVYRYLIIAAAVVAIIIIILAGIQWTASAGNSSTIESAKKRILGALTGLGLAVGSYVILYTINPNLVNFPNLKIKYITPEPVENLSFLSEAEYSSFTGQSILPPGEILKKAQQVTTELGLEDPCFMITIVGKESGGNPAAIGHDENYPRAACVGSRKRFLLGGLTYNKHPFIPPVANEADYSCEKHNGSKGPDEKLIRNDDVFDIRNPPDYGLDWRFSHGFGLGQITLKDTDKYWCNGQRGIVMAGKCFNIPQLLTVDAAAYSAGNLFKSNLACATRKGYTGDRRIQAAFWAYAAGCGNVEIDRGQDISQKGGVPRAWAHYLACKNNPSKFSEAEPSGANADEVE